MVRLQKFLAQAGIASRRASEAIIQAGHVEVNGRPVTRLGTQVDPAKDVVTVSGKPIQPLSHRYVAQSALGYETLSHDVAGMGPKVIPRAQLDAVVPAASYHCYGVLQGCCHRLFR